MTPSRSRRARRTQPPPAHLRRRGPRPPRTCRRSSPRASRRRVTRRAVARQTRGFEGRLRHQPPPRRARQGKTRALTKARPPALLRGARKRARASRRGARRRKARRPRSSTPRPPRPRPPSGGRSSSGLNESALRIVVDTLRDETLDSKACRAGTSGGRQGKGRELGSPPEQIRAPRQRA